MTNSGSPVLPFSPLWEPLILTLPLPPTQNHGYVNIDRGRRMPSVLARQWMQKAGWIAKAECMKKSWIMTKKQKVVMEYLVYWPDNRKRDVSNLGKFTEDSLEGIVYENDQYVLPRYMDFCVDKIKPRIELRIYLLT